MHLITNENLLRFILGCFIICGCKGGDQISTTGNESQVSALQDSLTLQDSFDGLEPEQCLIELKENFNDSSAKNKVIGSADNPICLPAGSPELAFRGRVDIQYTKGPSPLSLAIVVDNSGSLRNTDPGATIQETGRYKGILGLLNYFSTTYQDHFDKLRIGVFYTDFCLIPGESLVFDGGTNASFKSFVSAFSMPKAKSETNYIHAMQHANRFLSESSYTDWSKHLILFSDGMPWTAGQGFPSCKGTIDQLAKKIQTKGIDAMNLNFGLPCSPLYAGIVAADDKSCTVPTPGKYQGSLTTSLSSAASKSLSPFPQTDPLDILFAMKQHILFVDRHINPKGVAFHTVFLNKRPCFEASSTQSAFPESSKMLLHICDTIAPKDFFSQLTIKGGQNIAVNSTSELEAAFQKISESISQQLEFKEFRFYEKNSPQKVKVGTSCWQEKQKVHCPIKKEETVGKKSATGDQGLVNFHLPFHSYPDKGSIIIDATSTNGKKFEFQTDYFFKYANSSCEYKVSSTTGSGTNRKKHVLDTSPFRITCISESATIASGCSSEGENFEDGSKRRVKCEKRDQCGNLVEAEEICTEGKFQPLTECEDLVEKPCSRCQPNKWTYQTGEPGAEIKQIAYKMASDGKCERGEQLLRCDEVWKLVAGKEFNLSHCSEQLACPPLKELPVYGVPNQMVLLPSSSTLACDLQNQANHRAFECRNLKWQEVKPELASSYNCEIPQVSAIRCQPTAQINRNGIFGEVFGVARYKSETSSNCLAEVVIEKYRCENSAKWQPMDDLGGMQLYSKCTQTQDQTCLKNPSDPSCQESVEEFLITPLVFTKIADKSLPSGIVSSAGVESSGLVSTIIQGEILKELE